MNIHIRIAAQVLLFIIPPLTHADIQEEKLREILAWIPDGHYKYLHHAEPSAVEGLSYAESALRYADQSFATPKPRLATSGNQLLSWTGAKQVRLKIEQLQEGTEDKSPGYTHEYDGVTYHYNDVGPYIFILRYADVEEILSNSLKEGLITASDYSLFSKPVYRISYSAGNGMDHSGYCWLNPLNELLLAPTMDDLTEWAETGLGMRNTVLENQDYAGLFDLAEVFGDSWYILSFVSENRAVYKHYSTRMGEEEARQWLEGMRSKNEIVGKSWTLFDDHFIERTVNIFGSAEAAEGFVAEFKPRAEATSGQKPYTSLRKKAMQWKLSGHILIMEVDHKGKLFEAWQQYMNERYGDERKAEQH